MGMVVWTKLIKMTVDTNLTRSNSHMYNGRQTDEVAHVLAKAVTSSINFHIFDVIPIYITALIFNEMI